MRPYIWFIAALIAAVPACAVVLALAGGYVPKGDVDPGGVWPPAADRAVTQSGARAVYRYSDSEFGDDLWFAGDTEQLNRFLAALVDVHLEHPVIVTLHDGHGQLQPYSMTNGEADPDPIPFDWKMSSPRIIPWGEREGALDGQLRVHVYLGRLEPRALRVALALELALNEEIVEAVARHREQRATALAKDDREAMREPSDSWEAFQGGGRFGGDEATPQPVDNESRNESGHPVSSAAGG